MPTRKRSSGLSKPFKMRTFKPPQLGQIGSRDYTGPTGAGDPIIVAVLEQAMEDCRPVALVYRDDADDTPRIVSPAAMATKRGSRMLLGLEAPTEDEPESERLHYRCLYVAGIRRAELADGTWLPLPDDIHDANCLRQGRLEKFSQCPGDPPRAMQRPHPRYR
jgi:hypothetical protein